MNVIHIDAKKNAAYELVVAMESQMVEGEFLTGETVVDTAYYKDGAGAWTSLAIADTFSEVGTTGTYEVSLITTEMNHDWVMVKCTAADSRDALIIIRTTTVDVDDNGTNLSTLVSRIPNTLNTTASGNIGIDWANVENPATALDLSGTDIQLVDTVTTYTGNTPQTADHTASIADVPTVAEFNARTLASADYVITSDTIAGVTLVATTTDVTNQVTADVTAISGDATAANNAELAFDGTGFGFTNCTMPTITTYTGNTPQTADHVAELAKVPKSDSTVTWNATALASINAEADTALTDYDAPTNAEMEARTPTAAQLLYIVANAATGMPVTFTTAGGSTTVAVINEVDGAAGSVTNDQYNGRLLVFTDGTLKGVVTDITDYVGSTTTATITAIPFAPTSSHNARLI